MLARLEQPAQARKVSAQAEPGVRVSGVLACMSRCRARRWRAWEQPAQARKVCAALPGFVAAAIMQKRTCPRLPLSQESGQVLGRARAGTGSMLVLDAHASLPSLRHSDWLTVWPRRVQFKPQMLANLLWALATLAVAPPHLLSAVAAEVLRQLPGFKPQARGPQY